MNPRQIMQAKPLAVFLAVMILVSMGVALGAEDSSPRTFSPVQDGYVKDAPTVLPYHPERVLIQLTPQAFEDADLHFSMEKGASSPGTRTGLFSVDSICASAGVYRISRPFIEVKNTQKANELGLERWYMLETSGGTDPLALAQQLKKDGSIQEASVDWRAFPAAVPSDPLYDDHWGHNNTSQMISYDFSVYDHTGPTVGTVGFDANAQDAWDQAQGYGSSAVVIAIIDSGVEAGHPDLYQVAGYDYGDNDSNPDDDSSAAGHGTACAGVAAANANNGLGSTGVAPNCAIMPLKVANSAGSMYFTAIQNSLYFAADNGADIASMSLGAFISSDAATDAAILYATNAGVTILAATSNENFSYISYPANNQNVIAVGAAAPCEGRKRSSHLSTQVNAGNDTDPNGVTCDGETWWGSCYGVDIQDDHESVDVIAPTILPTTDLLGSAGYDSSDYSMFFNGTSCATPYAAGVCALIKSAFPSYTPAQVRAQLTGTAQDIINVESGAGWDRYSGYGLVDAAAAVGGASADNPPVAAFSGTPTSGDYPLYVNFNDSSSNAPSSWSWTFGDGGTSTAQNPSYTYTAAGNYTVSLTASNAFGSDVETKTAYITVTAPPAPADYATLPYSTGFETGAFDQYWDSASDFTGQVQITTVNAPHSGSYHMTMDCTSNGTYSTNQSWLHLDLSAEGQVDLAFWWTDYSDETHTTDGVYFSDNGGSSFVKVLDLNGASYTNSAWTEWNLDVDDLAASAGLSLNSTFVVKFQQYDNYMMTTDGMAFDDISVTGGGVVLNPPVAAFAGTPVSGDFPLNVQFTDASTNAPTSWSWTFGDGGTSTAQNPSYIYNAAGTFTVAMTATNADGSDVETKTGYITVTEPATPTPPVAAFAGTPVSGDYPLNVQFTDASSNTPTSWSWTFGDGGTSTVQNPSYTYNAVGTYTVSLTATNQYGNDAETKTDYITVTEPAVGAAMHVEDINVYRVQSGRKYYGRADITILDNGGAAVSGATVTAIYTGDATGTVTGVTGTNGVVTLSTPRKYTGSNDFCYEVTNVTHSTLSYDSSANLVTKSCEGGVDIFDNQYQQVVTEYSLAQNAPNPFNPMTEIAFSMPSDGNARLVVYNVKGQVVEVLVDGSFGSGTHRVTWDARDHASGVYFYRLETNSFSETRKMIMLK